MKTREEKSISISEDSTGKAITPIAKAVHDLLGVPVTMRSKNKMGICVENGAVIDFEYTGPILEQVLNENRAIQTIPTSGRYKNIPVIVAPIRNSGGAAIAALGIVDVVGTINLGAMFADSPLVFTKIKSRTEPKQLKKNYHKI